MSLGPAEASEGLSVSQQTLRSKPVPLLWKLQWEHLLGIGEGGADADESRFLTLIPDGMQLLLHGSWKPLSSPYLSQVLGSSCSFHGGRQVLHPALQCVKPNMYW